MTAFADPYLYPDSNCLKNKLNIRDKKELDRIERRLVLERIKDGPPQGDFDLAHLCAIHRHLFQDVYAWAGEIRTVEISKGGSQFQLRRFIEIGINDVYRRVVEKRFLKDLSRDDFARQAAQIIGDVNYAHPFRDGNGRTQLLYLKQLAGRAGHALDLTRFRGRGWIEASRESHLGRNERMEEIIAGAIAETGQ